MAGPDDALELVRLRRLMFRGMHGRDEPGPWERDAERMALGRLRADAGEPSGGGRGGASSWTGTSRGRRTWPPARWARSRSAFRRRCIPPGRFGFIFNVCADERYRGRGCARATTEALLEWFAARGVTRVDLHASGDAEHLYRSMGFAEHSVALSLDLARRD